MFDWVLDIVKAVIGLIFIVPPVIIAATALISFLTHPDPSQRAASLKKFFVSLGMTIVSLIVVYLLNTYVYDLIF
jgi:hypothetical protein